MNISRVEFAALFTSAFLLGLTPPAPANQFWITDVTIHESYRYADSAGVCAIPTARYRGAVDLTDDQWTLNSGIRVAGGTFTVGTGKNRTGITEDMRITLSVAQAGSDRVYFCTSDDPPKNNSYMGRGSVAISHGSGPETDTGFSQVKVETCPTVGSGDEEPKDDTGPGTPIIVDLDRNGFHLSGIENGVIFDIDADGAAEVVSWTRAAEMDGFLALDRNGNGVIDDGSELFGNHTLLLSGAEAPHGYLALAEFDKPIEGGNEDGSIDERDAIFSQLKIWIDFNHDGSSQEFEVVTLEDKGVTRLELWYVENRHVDKFGNQFRYNSKAWVEGPGVSDLPVKTSDVFFVVFE